MRTFFAVVASLAINVAVVGTLDWSTHSAQAAPAGEVTVVQLPDLSLEPAYAAATDSTIDPRAVDVDRIRRL